MSPNIKDLENRLWEAADHMRANSPLRLNEFAEPVLGLIFLKFAGVKHAKAAEEITEERRGKTKKLGGASVSRERPVSSADYHARGTLYVPEKARFSYLIELPEGTDMGKAVNDAMKAIEEENKELAGILPKTFQKLDNRTIITLLKNFNQIPDDIEGDAFGRIYEYFLGKFAISEGRRGGEFFTPTSIVKSIVEIIEPYYGKIYDPACGSGGMFVQSHEFVKRHFENGQKSKASREISIYGQESVEQTVRIAKMNLAIHGLSGDIRQGNTYYEDLHRSLGKFDFVMANPEFNVARIDKERMKGDPRFPYGLPRADNGNYIWIQIFLSALNEKGRAGFVMANSASDAGHSEKEIRQKMIEDGVVDVIVAVGPNMFYNVTLPVTLWFLDRGKRNLPARGAQAGTGRKDKILFIDARNIYRQIDRAHRDWTDEQIEQIASIVRSYRLPVRGTQAGGENGNLPARGLTASNAQAGAQAGKYQNIKGLCKVATIEEVKKAGYSLNPGRYVGVTDNGNGDDLPAPRPNTFYVYAIACDGGSYYIGHTEDLRERWNQHLSGTGADWTKRYKPIRIAHYEEYGTREEAIAREKELKTGFGRKWLKREIKAGRARQAGGNFGDKIEKLHSELKGLTDEAHKLEKSIFENLKKLDI